MSKQEITKELAYAAATDAGRRNAIRAGRPPSPWMREDLEAASAEFHRICREYKLDAFKLP